MREGELILEGMARGHGDGEAAHGAANLGADLEQGEIPARDVAAMLRGRNRVGTHGGPTYFG